MEIYKINIILSEDKGSLEDIFTKVLLKELLMILKNKNNVMESSYDYFSFNKERGKN